MKKAFIFSFGFLVLLALSALSIDPANPLTGRWQQKVRGATALLVFRTNNTYDIFVDGKVFTSGQYTVRQDTFALADPGCNSAYYGTYTLGFFAQDSVRFTAISDTCKARKGAMHKFTAGRVKATGAK